MSLKFGPSSGLWGGAEGTVLEGVEGVRRGLIARCKMYQKTEWGGAEGTVSEGVEGLIEVALAPASTTSLSNKVRHLIDVKNSMITH